MKEILDFIFCHVKETLLLTFIFVFGVLILGSLTLTSSLAQNIADTGQSALISIFLFITAAGGISLFAFLIIMTKKVMDFF